MKFIDLSWGAAGAPLLPRSLRNLWSGEPLPAWIASELHLPEAATPSELDESIWEKFGQTHITDRHRNFLLNLVQGRRSEIFPLRVFTQPVPHWLDLDELPFSTRTRNCLVRGKLFANADHLGDLTFDRLFGVQAMGVVSILEFACIIEAAIHRANKAGRQPHALSEAQLLAIVSEPWVDQVGAADPRFADVIPYIPHATIFEILDSLTSGLRDDSRLLQKLAGAMPEIQERLNHIGSQFLETQLKEFLHAISRFEGVRLTALIDRFGWGGKPSITLAEAGTRLRITRERVRQLQEKIDGRLKAIPFRPFLPRLDDAMHVLSEAGTISVDAASRLLKSRGISKEEFHPASVIAAAIGCGRTPLIRLQTIGKTQVVSRTAIANADDIIRVAYRQTHASGASNVAEVAAELDSLGIRVPTNDIRAVLRDFSDVEFLEEEWFCHRPDNPERDRLRNVTRKILSVASPVELGLLRDGVRREYQYRKHRGIRSWSLLVPPKSVMRAYYLAHPEFLIDDNDRVKPLDPLDYRVELALNDAILVDVLRSSPACVLDRTTFASECGRRSMNMSTFGLYLTYSPIIAHLGTDIWSLRGVRVDPTAVEAVRVANALRPREKRMLDHGWTPDGQLWVASRIPGSHLPNLVFTIPGAIKPYLVGRQFEAKDEDGVVHGAIRINNEGASYGFTPFLRQRGADEGDILVAEFDLAGNQALLKLGDDELLEEMSPQI